MSNKTTKVGFSIDGEWFTDFVRSQWSEGSYDKSLGTLEAAFGDDMTLDQKYDLIRGKKKLVGINDLEFVNDTWNPDLDKCAYGKYPDPIELAALAAEGNKLQFENHQKQLCEIQDLMSDFNELRYCDGDIAQNYYDRYKSFPQKIRDQVGEWNPSNRKFSDNRGLASTTALNNLDTFVKRQVELETAPMPEQDVELTSPHGWVLPDGSFYPCGYMEHIWLAGMFNKTEQQQKKPLQKFHRASLW